MWSSQTLSYFAINYFNFYGKTSLYGTLSAFAILIGGGSSNLIAGYYSDRFESQNYRTKSYVGALMSLMIVPLLIVCFSVHSSFYLSMVMFFLVYLCGEGWMGPNMAMI